MSIPAPTFRKLLREHLTGEPAPPASDAEATAIGAAIEARLAGLDGLDLHEGRWRAKECSSIREITVRDPRHAWYGGAEIWVYRNPEGQVLVGGPPWAQGAALPFTTLDALVALLTACRERLDQQQTHAARRTKVRGFKAQAIVGSVRQLADELGFTFFAETDSVKLTLYVDLGGDDLIELHIPFSRFQELLPNLRQTILSLRELHGNGIRFRLKRATSLNTRDIAFTNRPTPN